LVDGYKDVSIKVSITKARENVLYPSVWKEPYYSGKAGSPKYDKIIEIIDELNANGIEIEDILADIANGVLPDAHKASHQDGGSDEISVAGLSGDLADLQDPKLHATAHEDGGGDEIDVSDLSGILAEPQVPSIIHGQIVPSAGASLQEISSNAWYGVGVYFPVSVSGQRCSTTIILPSTASGTFTLHCWYFQNHATNTIEATIDVSTYTVGETPTSNNSRNGYAFNFVGSGTAFEITENTVTLPGVSGGDRLTVRITETNAESYYMVILGIYITWA
jgi:hypothetical protein